MVKQIVFALVAVAFMSQAHAGVDVRDGGEARDLKLNDASKKAHEAGARSTQQMVRDNASKKLDEYLGSVLDAKDKQVILDLAMQDKVVAKALVELVKSKKADQVAKTDKNALIDDAQTSALQALAKIPNLAKRVGESNLDKNDDKLTATERTALNLVVQVPSKARKDWAKDDKAVAAEAIKIFGEEARSKSLDEALKEMTRRMANHPDPKLRSTINEDAIKKFCS